MSKPVILFLLSLMSILSVPGQEGNNPKFISEFVEVDGVRVHYLDFGGKGLPVILVHSEGWNALTFKEFGTLLAGQNRVLAITRPGYGDSEPGKYDVPSQGDYLLAFADALGINKAVYIGNASVSSELTYLAENYSDRMAGVVYLSGLAVPWLDIYSEDPTRAFEMFMRASPGNNNKEEIAEARKHYRPKHLNADSVSINVPALAIVSQTGRTGTETGVAALVLAGSPLMEELRNKTPPSPTKDYLDRIAKDEDFRNEMIRGIKDSLARKYFTQLANDPELQKEVYRFHTERVLPATLSAQDALLKAYGKNMKLIKLDVPQVIGYEYRDSPHLIIDHVRSFLRELPAD